MFKLINVLYKYNLSICIVFVKQINQMVEHIFPSFSAPICTVKEIKTQPNQNGWRSISSVNKYFLEFTHVKCMSKSNQIILIICFHLLYSQMVAFSRVPVIRSVLIVFVLIQSHINLFLQTVQSSIHHFQWTC